MKEKKVPLRFCSVPFSNPLGFTWVETLERKGKRLTRSSKEQETIMLSCERKLTGTMKEERNESI